MRPKRIPEGIRHAADIALLALFLLGCAANADSLAWFFFKVDTDSKLLGARLERVASELEAREQEYGDSYWEALKPLEGGDDGCSWQMHSAYREARFFSLPDDFDLSPGSRLPFRRTYLFPCEENAHLELDGGRIVCFPEIHVFYKGAVHAAGYDHAKKIVLVRRITGADGSPCGEDALYEGMPLTEELDEANCRKLAQEFGWNIEFRQYPGESRPAVYSLYKTNLDKGIVIERPRLNTGLIDRFYFFFGNLYAPVFPLCFAAALASAALIIVLRKKDGRAARTSCAAARLVLLAFLACAMLLRLFVWTTFSPGLLLVL